QGLGRLRQRRVVEDHAVQIEECLELLRRILRDVQLQRREVLARLVQRGLEAAHLGFDLALRDLVVHHLEARGGDEVRVADGDAAGNRMPMQDEVHSPSPNLSAISFRIAATACSASPPLASMSTVVPWPAASIITPMMLFAFTRRPLRESQISHW